MIENVAVTSRPKSPGRQLGLLAAQLGGVWFAAAFLTAVGGWLVMIAFLAGAPVVVLIVLVPVVALCYAAGLITKPVSRLTMTWGLRMLWAAAVGLLGFAGAVFATAATFAGEPDVSLPAIPWVLVVTVPFPLVAALFAARWRVRIAGAALIVGLGALAVVLPQGLPGDNAAARAAAEKIPRDQLVVVTPPSGYQVEKPVWSNGTVQFTLERKVGTPIITVTTQPCSGCGDTAEGAVRNPDAFTVEYGRTVGNVNVVASAYTRDNPGADVLRQVAQSAPPASDAHVMSWLPPAPGYSDRSTFRQFGYLWVVLVHGCSASPDCG